MQSRTKNAKRNIVSGLVSKCVSLLFPFVVRTCVIHYLGTVYLGLGGLFSSILQVLSLAELGFGEAMVFSLYAPLQKNDTTKICAILNLYKKIYRAIGIVILVGGLAVMPFLKYFINGGYPKGVNVELLYIINLFNVVVSYWLFAYKNSLLSAAQNISVSNKIGMVMQCAMSIAQIIILVTLRNYYVYVLIIPAFTIARNLITEVVSKRLYPDYFCKGKLPKEDIRDIEKRVTGLFIYKFCGTMRTSFDNIVISSFCGIVMLGKYENYYFIVHTIMSFFVIFSSSITAGIGNSMVSESVEKNYEDYQKFLFIYEWITGWCTVCLFCLYQPFMLVWVGEDLMLGGEIVALMSAYFYILKSGDMCYIYRQAAGIWWKDKLRPAVEAVANLVLNIVLVKYFGVAGVLMATIVTMLIINTYWGAKTLFNTYFKRSMKEYFINLLLYLVITTFAVAVTYGICQLFAFTGIVRLLYNMLICCIVPNVVYLLCYRSNKNFRYTLQLLKRLLD